MPPTRAQRERLLGTGREKTEAREADASVEGCNVGVKDGETAGQPVLYDLGNFLGLTPIGNLVTGTEMHISHIADGKIVERWGQGDNLGLMQQLGVVPRPGEAQGA